MTAPAEADRLDNPRVGPYDAAANWRGQPVCGTAIATQRVSTRGYGPPLADSATAARDHPDCAWLVGEVVGQRPFGTEVTLDDGDLVSDASHGLIRRDGKWCRVERAPRAKWPGMSQKGAKAPG